MLAGQRIKSGLQDSNLSWLPALDNEERAPDGQLGVAIHFGPRSYRVLLGRPEMSSNVTQQPALFYCNILIQP